MPRRNQPKHQNRQNLTDRYDVDYVFLPKAPEIAAVVAPMLKTIYRNMACAPWADEVHEVRGEKDKYLNMIRRQQGDIA